jgi:hypothetical protein
VTHVNFPELDFKLAQLHVMASQDSFHFTYFVLTYLFLLGF